MADPKAKQTHPMREAAMPLGNCSRMFQSIHPICERPKAWMRKSLDVLSRPVSAKQILNVFSQHLVDATGSFFSVAPIFCLAETTILSDVISPEVSLNTKLVGVTFSYCGSSSLYSRGRDLSRWMFGVSQASPERTQAVHDTAYLVAYSSIINPIIYKLGGASPHGTTKATIVMAALMPAIGYVSGYAIDAYRDFAGIKESERLPENIRCLSPTRKRALAISFIAASILSMFLMYGLTPGGLPYSNENNAVQAGDTDVTR